MQIDRYRRATRDIVKFPAVLSLHRLLVFRDISVKTHSVFCVVRLDRHNIALRNARSIHHEVGAVEVIVGVIDRVLERIRIVGCFEALRGSINNRMHVAISRNGLTVLHYLDVDLRARMGPLGGKGIVGFRKIVYAHRITRLIRLIVVGPTNKLIAIGNFEAFNVFKVLHTVRPVVFNRFCGVFALRILGHRTHGIVRIIRNRNRIGLIAPHGVKRNIVLDADFILGLIHVARTVGLGVPTKDYATLRSRQLFWMQNIGIAILGVFVTIGRNATATAVCVIRNREGACADVVRVKHDIGANLGIEVEQRVDVVALVAGTRGPANKLLAIDFRGLAQLVLVNRVTIRNIVNSLSLAHTVHIVVVGYRDLGRLPDGVQGEIVGRHGRIEVERITFAELVVVPAGKHKVLFNRAWLVGRVGQII